MDSEADEGLEARIAAASPDELAALAADRRAGIRRLVASNPATPPAVLARLAEDGNLWVRRDAAANSASPPAALDRLYRAGSAPGFAGPAPPDPTLDPAELAELAAGGEWARRLATRHPATPPEALARLAGDPVPAIRTAAATHPAAPAEARERFRARESEASGGAPEKAALARLAGEAAEGLEIPLASALALAEEPSTPASTLACLAEHGASAVRAVVAAHPNSRGAHRNLLRRAGSTDDLVGFAPPDPDLPAADLAQLARGGGWARLLAARHPATAPDDLARLAADADPLVRSAALANSACPADVRGSVAAPDPSGRDPLGLGDGRNERLRRALSAIGSLEEEAAERLEESARRTRATWR